MIPVAEQLVKYLVMGHGILIDWHSGSLIKMKVIFDYNILVTKGFLTAKAISASGHLKTMTGGLMDAATGFRAHARTCEYRTETA